MADLMQQARAKLAVTAQENMRKARALFDDNLIDAREVAGQFSDWLRVNAACQADEFPEAAGQLSATAELIDRLAAPEGFVLVPELATEDMLVAGFPHGEIIDESFDPQGAWADMLAARPQGVKDAR